MNLKYTKILLTISLLIVLVISIASISVKLADTNTKPKEETISESAKNEIDKLFFREKSQKIDSVMKEKAIKYKFNGNVLVACKGTCIYEKSFGYSDMISKKEMSKDDIFQLASVSKQFTAMAIMILKERKKLSYEDTVTKYLVNFPYRDITIRMLLNHTSGLPNYMWLVEHHWQGKNCPYNNDILNLMAEQNLPLYFKPGSRWDYSNTGYVVLASIVEQISGQEFAQFMSKNIFEPVKMENTFVYSNCSEKGKKRDMLMGYQLRGRRYVTIPETVNDGAVGDKGVYSTTEDLFKWDQALYNNLLVSDSTIAEAISTFKLRGKYEIQYGFGFRISKQNDKKIVYHNGRWNGFRTSILRYVEDTNTIIVLNHTSSSLNRTIVRGIQQILSDSLDSDFTQELVTSILEDGIESAIDLYFENCNDTKIELDTMKIINSSKILHDTNYPHAAEQLLLFKDMYIRGELEARYLKDKNFANSLLQRQKI